MSDYVADTHALVWYLEADPRLGAQASVAFEEADRGQAIVFIPSICLVEVVYLQEKGRIPAQFKAKLEAALSAGTSGLVVASLTAEVADACARVPRIDVPDMPDRIIAATALHLGLDLITKDHRIRLSSIRTIW